MKNVAKVRPLISHEVHSTWSRFSNPFLLPHITDKKTCHRWWLSEIFCLWGISVVCRRMELNLPILLNQLNPLSPSPPSLSLLQVSSILCSDTFAVFTTSLPHIKVISISNVSCHCEVTNVRSHKMASQSAQYDVILTGLNIPHKKNYFHIKNNIKNG